jgi:hypothetical protein
VGSEFVNRQSEIARLHSNLRSGINSILLSPRRRGKSLLVNRVFEKVAEEDDRIKVVRLDLFNIRTETEFYERFTREVLRSTSSKWEDWISTGKSLLKSIIPRFSVAIDPIHDFSVSFEMHPSEKSAEDTLMLPEQIARLKKIKIIVWTDEFQNPSYYKKPLEFQKLLRASWQQQKEICYGLYGSKRHMIADLFENKAMPFYKFGDWMFFSASKHRIGLTTSNLHSEKTGKSIQTDAAEAIAHPVKNLPYFVQQLAEKTWITTSKEATVENVHAALNNMINENSILYLKEVENLSNTQLNLLKALCDGIKKLSAAETLQKYSLGTFANVLRIKSALEQKEIIDFLGLEPEFIVPVFELCLKRIYF